MPFSSKPLARLPCLLCYFHLENLCMEPQTLALKWFFLVQHSGFQIQLSIQHSCKLHLFRKKNFCPPENEWKEERLTEQCWTSAQAHMYTISTAFCGNETAPTLIFRVFEVLQASSGDAFFLSLFLPCFFSVVGWLVTTSVGAELIAMGRWFLIFLTESTNAKPRRSVTFIFFTLNQYDNVLRLCLH